MFDRPVSPTNRLYVSACKNNQEDKATITWQHAQKRARQKKDDIAKVNTLGPWSASGRDVGIKPHHAASGKSSTGTTGSLHHNAMLAISSWVSSPVSDDASVSASSLRT
mmetsp:Transcript_43616/g.97846  ORF Transcript_43616/g.97846 Transcript_43616/m.97846 type:complete len:109 (-) Transcript_43616:469-795(-)